MKTINKTTHGLTTKTLILACTVVFPFLSQTTLTAAEYTYPNGEPVSNQSLSGTYSNPEGTALTFQSYHTIQNGGTILLAGEGEKTLGQVNGPGTIRNQSSGSTVFNGEIYTNLSLEGSGSTTFNRQAQATSLNISGSGDATFKGYTAFTNITLAGSGEVTFAQQVGGSNLTISGSGKTNFQGNLNVSGNVSIGGTGNTTFSADINWANSFTISSSGKTLFDETSHFNGLGTLNVTGTGTTEIRGTQQNNIGTINVTNAKLILNQNGGYTNSNIVVNGNGIVVMADSDQTPTTWGGSNKTVTLNDNAVLVVSGTDQTFSNIIVNGHATIDMGLNSISTITVQNISFGTDSSLTLIGYDESTKDFISFKNFTSGSMSDINTTPIPEPSTYAACGGILVFGLAVLRRRKNRA